MNELQLTKELISIPSEVSQKCDEKSIAEFIYQLCESIPWLSISRQYIAQDRFNVIAKSKGSPKLLVAGHMDTVPEKQEQRNNRKLEGDKLFGLGALDTKGGIASLLIALSEMREVEGLICVFYCDEEYNFLGMKKFIESAPKSLKQALFIEPTDLKLWNAHRGVIEIMIAIEGKTAHGSNPENGANAITALSKAVVELENWLLKFNDPILGVSTLNVASIRGGLKAPGKDLSIRSQANCIADYVEAVIEIRPPRQELKAGAVIEFISKFVGRMNCKLTRKEIRLDLGSLNAEKSSFLELRKSIREIVGKVEILNPQNCGYGDGQLLNEKLKIPVAYFGPKGEGMHEESEYVEIGSLTLTKRVYGSFIQRVLGHANSRRENR